MNDKDLENVPNLLSHLPEADLTTSLKSQASTLLASRTQEHDQTLLAKLNTTIRSKTTTLSKMNDSMSARGEKLRTEIGGLQIEKAELVVRMNRSSLAPVESRTEELIRLGVLNPFDKGVVVEETEDTRMEVEEVDDWEGDDGDESVYLRRILRWARRRRDKRRAVLSKKSTGEMAGEFTEQRNLLNLKPNDLGVGIRGQGESLSEIRETGYSRVDPDVNIVERNAELERDEGSEEELNFEEIEEEFCRPSMCHKDLKLTQGFRIPGEIATKLFPYQRTCLRWLHELYTQQVGKSRLLLISKGIAI